MKPIEPDLHDELLRRRVHDDIERCGNNPECLKQAAKLLADSYIQARVAAKWIGSEMGQNFPSGSLGGPDSQNIEPELD